MRGSRHGSSQSEGSRSQPNRSVAFKFIGRWGVDMDESTWLIKGAHCMVENRKKKKEETSNPFKSSPPATYKTARINPFLRGSITS